MQQKIAEIKSSPQWRAIPEGDTKSIRSYFDCLNKETIRTALLEEQHGLCAYCMRRIENKGASTTIEHWIPLSWKRDQLKK